MTSSSSSARRLLSAIVVLLTAASVLALAAPAGAQTESQVALAAPPYAVISGGGWGHGVGMSQYGSRGRADAGQTYEQILAAYYDETSLSDTAFGGDIEVHLQTARVATFLPEGPILVKGGATVLATAGAGDTVVITRLPDSYTIELNGNDVCDPDGISLQICPMNQLGIESANGNPTPVRVAETGYRYQWGRFRIRAATTSSFHLTIASMTVDEYLYGLGEMPPSWPMDALQTQAVAGRTFAVRNILTRRASRNWDVPWDIYSSVNDQAYVGMRVEAGSSGGRWVNAVDNTLGEVLIHNGNVIYANYSSSNGGYSANNSYVWGGAQVDYLSAVSDPYDSFGNPYGSWERSFTLPDLSRWFAYYSSSNVGTITDISFAGPFGESGRVDQANVTLVGTSGTKVISGAQFRIRINAGLRRDGTSALSTQVLSTNFTFDGIFGLEEPIPTDHSPEGKFRFDEINTDVEPQTVAIRGWALDQDADEPLVVRIRRNGVQIAALTANSSRPTIGARFGVSDDHGIDFVVPLVDGLNEICLIALDVTPGQPATNLGCRSVAKGAPTGEMAPVGVDYVGAPQLVIGGTAADGDHSGRIGIHIYVDSSYAGGTATDAASGQWSFKPVGLEGVHKVCSFALDNVAGGQATKLGCENVAVTDRIDDPGTTVVSPVGLYENVTTSGRTVTFTGWVFDPNSQSPVRLIINVDGQRYRNTYASVPRPGLGIRFDRDDRIGFNEAVALTAGRHQICFWATKLGPNTPLGCRTITVS